MNEVKYKINLDGVEEYKTKAKEMKEVVADFRKEVEQLNAALEKEIELLKKLGCFDFNA